MKAERLDKPLRKVIALLGEILKECDVELHGTPPASLLTPDEATGISFVQVQTNYHLYCPSLPRCFALSAERKQHIRARMEEAKITDSCRAFFQMVEASDFLCGRNGVSSFKSDIDWLFKPTNFVKVLEGRYANRPGQYQKHVALTAKDHSDERF